MKALMSVLVGAIFIAFSAQVSAESLCALIKDRSALSEYESGGPFSLEHFKLTKGRTDLREFLWRHWHGLVKGVAEAKVGTIDAGTVTALYIIRPDAKGKWGIDVAIDIPLQPPCTSFHADSIVRLPIAKPDEDYPSQTLGYWPADRLPKQLVPETDDRGSKFYQVQLVKGGKPVGDPI